jgi:hypothetical protein
VHTPNTIIMATYLFQNRPESLPAQCGPISLYNWLRYKQIPVSLDYLIKQCKANLDYGTRVKLMEKTVHTVNEIFNTTISQFPPDASATPFDWIKFNLYAGRPIIILYHWADGANSGNHYALIDTIYNDYGQLKFRIINHSFETPIKIVCAREIKSMLLPHTDKHFTTPVIWC